jgi:hypothetical protein
MNETLKRAARTFAQGFIGILILMAVPALQNLIQDAGDGQIDVDLNFWRAVIIAAIAGGVVSLISFAQNLLEERDVIPKVLK